MFFIFIYVLLVTSIFKFQISLSFNFRIAGELFFSSSFFDWQVALITSTQPTVLEENPGFGKKKLKKV